MKVRFFRFLDRALIGVPIVVFVAFFLYGGSKQKIMSNKKAALTNSQMDITAVNWNSRGAWDDSFRLDFPEGWVFPWGSNHLSSVEVLSKGEVWPRWNDTNRIAALDVPLAIVPGITQFSYFRTPSDSYILSWNNAAINRNTNILASAAIELRRDGERIVTQNGISMATARELPFCRIGWGQDEDWIEHYFSNEVAEINSVGYLDWVDSIALEPGNGFYKLTVTLSNAPPEIVNLTVGDYSVAVTNAGDYVFLLEKGVRYPIGFSLLPEGVSYSCEDGGPSIPPEPEWPDLPAQRKGMSTDVYYYTYKTFGDDGNGQELVIPSQDGKGFVFWSPMLEIFPNEKGELSPFTVFIAEVFDIPFDAIPSIVWESGGKVIGRGIFFMLEDSHFNVGEITVTAIYRNVELHGKIIVERHVRETSISIEGGGLILVSGPHLNERGEMVQSSRTDASLDLWWTLTTPGKLRLESNCGGAVSARVFETDVPVSLPMEWHADVDDVGRTNLIVSVSGTLTNGMFTFSFVPDDESFELYDDVSLDLVEINVEAVATWPTNRNRHVFGPKEKFVITTNPAVELFCEPEDGIQISGNTVAAPDRPGNFFVMLRAGKASAWLSLRCIAPTMLRGANPRPFEYVDWVNLERTPWPIGYAAVDMHIDTWLEPTYVSFKNLCLQEGYSLPTNRTGWYTDDEAFPDDKIAHGAKAGAMGDKEYVNIVNQGNYTYYGDCVGGIIGFSNVYSNGSYQLSIPLRWFVEGGGYTNSLPDNLQIIWVYSNGTMRVSKNGCVMERTLNGEYTIISGQRKGEK